MTDKTYLAMPGKKVIVPRPLKRTLQVAGAVALTCASALALMVGSGLLQSKGPVGQVFNVWLAFIYRTDIQATMILTAFVTVLFVYWQRDQERR
jgi:hypothetical protein